MIQNEARYLYDWTRTSKLSYGDFLRAKQFERSIRYAIDDQTKQLVGSNQELLERGFSILSDELSSGFTTLSQEIRAVEESVREGFSEVIGVLNWGFNEVLISLGHLNDSLAELIRLARSPSQTWAYEQFEIARDEFRRALYPEALESVSRAINGFGSNTGYRTDFRFHFLLGAIRLGSYRNIAAEIVDPGLAENAFLQAARYAERDFAREAAVAFISAGRAAYVQNKVVETIAHTKKGIALAPKLSEGWYQLARAQLSQGMRDLASEALVEAILLDVGYAVSAACDVDFLSNRPWLTSSLNTALSKYQRRHKVLGDNLDKVIEAVESYAFAGLEARSLLADKIQKIKSAQRSAQERSSTVTLLGVQTAINQLMGIFPAIPGYFETFRARFLEHNASVLAAKAPVTSYNPGLLDALGRGFSVAPFAFVGSCTLYNPKDYYAQGPKGDLPSALIFAFWFSLMLCAAISTAIVIWRGAKQHEAASDRAWRASINKEMDAIRRQALPKQWDASTARAQDL